MEDEKSGSSWPTIPNQIRRLGRPKVKTVFQLSATLTHSENAPAASVWHRTIETLYSWLNRKFPETPSPRRLANRDFELDIEGHGLSIAALEQLGAWALEYFHPDTEVPGRTWRTEIALRRRDDSVSFGIRTRCASMLASTTPVTPSRPAVVKMLSAELHLHEARQIDGKVWRLNDVEDLAILRSMLISSQRQLPIILLTEVDSRALPSSLTPLQYLLDAERLARATLGLAYVVTMPTTLGYVWTSTVGKEWSAFMGAVRTYLPGLSFDKDSPYEHPLAMPNRILFWKHGSLEGEEAFEKFLLGQAYAHSSSKRANWSDLLFLQDVRLEKASRETDDLIRTHSTSIKQLSDSYELKIKALSDKLLTADQQVDEALSEAARYEKAASEVEQKNSVLRARVSMLEAAVKQKTGKGFENDMPLPERFEDIAPWAEQNLVSKLDLHSRALRGLKGAQYKSVKTVVEALQLLATEYRDMCLGEDGARDRFNSRIAALQLKVSRSITESRAGEEGDEYYVEYPPASGKSHLLEWHLKKGNSREERDSLRIYFFWHSESQQVIVGWLPGHLSTRIS